MERRRQHLAAGGMKLWVVIGPNGELGLVQGRMEAEGLMLMVKGMQTIFHKDNYEWVVWCRGCRVVPYERTQAYANN